MATRGRLRRRVTTVVSGRNAMMIPVELWRGRGLGVELRCWQLPETVSDIERDFLSNHERARAAGFKLERRRVEYIASRAYLRRALAEVLGAAPSSIPITPDDAGKPQHAGGLQFNLSHSANAVLIGWGERPLGVDLEASQRKRTSAGCGITIRTR